MLTIFSRVSSQCGGATFISDGIFIFDWFLISPFSVIAQLQPVCHKKDSITGCPKIENEIEIFLKVISLVLPKKDWCIFRECWTWPFWLQMHHSWSTLCRYATRLISLKLFSTQFRYISNCSFHLFVKVGEAHQYYTEMVALVVTSIVLQVSSKYCSANYLLRW